MTFTLGSLFSGIGGLDLAAQWAGFDTAWFVEKEPYCQKVLARHWPSTPIHGDIFDAHDLPHVDVIAGGFPCQPFSVAGQRRGAADERFLLPEMLRVISEVKPHVVLFENVPGFASLNDGAEFKLLLGALAEMGFDAEWGHIRASDVGAPHRRERWFLVAYSKNARLNRWERIAANDGKCRAHNTGLCRTCVDGGNVFMDHASGAGLEGRAQTGNAPGGGQQRNELVTGYGTSPLVNSNCGRCEQHNPQIGSVQVTNAGCATNAGGAQSRLGRNADGLPCGMDAHRWPARPGEPQHEYEPPRTTGEKSNRAARLKALGNAVVPQVVYPLFVSIHEWLDGG